MKDSKKQTVSVVIPNYNKGIYIGQTLDSIINQTMQPNEIIVVDDCSTDNSKSVLSHYLSRYPELIRVFFLSENHGVQYARNYGAKQAISEFITFIDSDDWYYDSNKLENEMKYAKYNRIVCSDYVNYNQITGKYESIGLKLFDRLDFKMAPFTCLLYQIHMEAWPYAYIISKEVFFRINGYSFKYNLFEDLDIIIKLYINGQRMYKVPGIGRVYRINDSGTVHLSNAKTEAMNKAISLIREQYVSYIPWYDVLLHQAVICSTRILLIPQKIVKKLRQLSGK